MFVKIKIEVLKHFKDELELQKKGNRRRILNQRQKR